MIAVTAKSSEARSRPRKRRMPRDFLINCCTCAFRDVIEIEHAGPGGKWEKDDKTSSGEMSREHRESQIVKFVSQNLEKQTVKSKHVRNEQVREIQMGAVVGHTYLCVYNASTPSCRFGAVQKQLPCSLFCVRCSLFTVNIEHRTCPPGRRGTKWADGE